MASSTPSPALATGVSTAAAPRVVEVAAASPREPELRVAPPPQPRALGRRATGWLYLLLCALATLPIVLPRYVPTTDGPCHTYNSFILRALVADSHPFLARHYELNLAPWPNWTSEAAIALLLGVLSPRLAEKVVVVACLWLFLGGAWYLLSATRREEPWIAFLAPPFAFHWLFQMGFYNFSLSLGAMLLAIGAWWRHGERPGWRFVLALEALLLFAYFSHVVPFGIALVAIGGLILADLAREVRRLGWRGVDRRRGVLQAAILLPQLPLPAWFFLSPHEPLFSTAPWSLARQWSYLLELRVLITLGEPLRYVAGVLSLAVGLLLALTLARRLAAGRGERSDAFLALALAALAIYFAAPSAAASGSLIKERLTLFPFLLVLPGLAPGLGHRGGRLAAGAALVITAFDLGYQAHAWTAAGREVERFLAPLAAVRPQSRIVPLSFAPPRPTDYLRHALGHPAIAAELIDWDNYEAKLPVFPVRFRRDIHRPALGWAAVSPGSLPLERGRWLIDAVYTWQMPQGEPLRQVLARHYDRVAAAGGGELWQRRGPPGG